MSESATYESMVVTTDAGVAEVVLSGPGKGNAMGPSFFRELPRVFESLERDPAVRTVIVRGKGGAFTYGLDLAAVAPDLMPLLSTQGLAAERTQLLRMIGEWQRGFDLVERCSK